MPAPAPLALYEAVIEPEWLDWNDHLNVAYFLLAFDRATDALYRYLGVAEDYIEERGHSMFAFETHVVDQRELRGGDPIRVTTQLLGFDDKRIHFIHQMYHGADGYLAAANDWLAIHVDLARRRAARFPPDIAARLAEIREAHAGLPTPPAVGRAISLDSRKPA